ncbi:MAG TPA: helix-hairpin-helix domain-containing protein [Bacteroidales bacterium]|nr:helix-hairpin-helix domain-containing protein [Bacteroidales bacterium]
MYFKTLALLFILSSALAYGQNEGNNEVTSSLAEELAADEADPGLVQVYTEKLSELSDEPVSLNSADEDEISRLFFLTTFQVKAIIDYVRAYGKIVSFFEIANIPGFNSEVAEMMLPFITLEEIVHPGAATTTSFQALTNLFYRNDSGDTISEGSDLKYLGKYKLTTGRITLGVVAEKDKGEKLFYGSPPCPDFFSGYIGYKGKAFVRNIIIGDFSSRFGQGAAVSTGTASFNSLASKGFSTAASGFRGYTSADENNFFRGVAGTFSYGRFSLSLFYSSNRLDATLDPSSGNVTSFYTGGIHNSASLRLKKDVITASASGINICADLSNLRIGMTYTGTRLSLPVEKNDEPENVFSFNGSHNEVMSVYYSTVLKKNLLYGEFSSDNSLNYSIFQGVSISPAGRLTVNLIGGITSQGYTSFNGKSPVTGSSNRSGNSIMANLTFEASRNLFLSGGCLYTNYPWIRQGCSSPSISVKKEVRIKYLPSESISLEALYNRNLAGINSDEQNRVPQLTDKNAGYFRVTFRFSPSPEVTLATRVDAKGPNRHERGYAILQDLMASIGRTPISIWCRYCIFSTDSWNTRIYAYENDLLYSFSIPAMYGEGCRSYVMLKCRMGNLGEIRFKYSLTSAADGLKINNQNEFRLQVKIVL